MKDLSFYTGVTGIRDNGQMINRLHCAHLEKENSFLCKWMGICLGFKPLCIWVLVTICKYMLRVLTPGYLCTCYYLLIYVWGLKPWVSVYLLLSVNICLGFEPLGICVLVTICKYMFRVEPLGICVLVTICKYMFRVWTPGYLGTC